MNVSALLRLLCRVGLHHWIERRVDYDLSGRYFRVRRCDRCLPQVHRELWRPLIRRQGRRHWVEIFVGDSPGRGGTA